MPVLNPESQSLELLYVRSLSAQGNPIYETRRFRNLKVDADPQVIYEVAEAIQAISIGEFAKFQVTTASALTV